MRPRNAHLERFLDLGRRAGGWPRVGTPEFDALNPRDPRWFAAVAHAALCWAHHLDPDTIRRDIEAEIEARRWADNELLIQMHKSMPDGWLEDCPSLAADIRRRANSPSWAELQARRGAAA